MKILDGKKLARVSEKKLKKETSIFIKKTGILPGLGILLVGDDPASKLYVSLKKKKAQELGFFCEVVVLSKRASQKKVIAALEKLQAQKNIHGGIVQLPLPCHLTSDEILKQLDVKKDIDCLHPYNLARLFSGKKLQYAPPTAESVIRLIQFSKKKIRNTPIAVVARGFFGRQIAALCRMYGGNVLQTNSEAKDFLEIVRRADIVIAAIGKPRCITGEMIKKGATVIDVGTSEENGRVVGDVDFKTVSKKASAMTPVPGGVGPLTVALLMKNVFNAAQNSR
ncbi:bifunctional 5,10-methylenetetrahydrofolate dehydrogenase/5,10-methenyltetrahydrofolate cyclohydrolase [Candidatus Uhrbacteria bacterium]|nr:bifunctional 5,10-methylenetetrahydrofolate dehydrogenase/5,10-methenyltetrahydrofolate cyclohydrolase [Candidatus Uhrbacteria bacterium]